MPNAVVIAGFIPRYVEREQSEEPSHVRARPNLVESSKSLPRKRVGDFVHFTLYKNDVSPLPENIPLRMRLSRSPRNTVDSAAERQTAHGLNRVAIQRTQPKSYSDQVMEGEL